MILTEISGVEISSIEYNKVNDGEAKFNNVNAGKEVQTISKTNNGFRRVASRAVFEQYKTNVGKLHNLRRQSQSYSSLPLSKQLSQCKHKTGYLTSSQVVVNDLISLAIGRSSPKCDKNMFEDDQREDDSVGDAETYIEDGSSLQEKTQLDYYNGVS